MPIQFRKRISRTMVQAEPDTLFVFGDNLKRRGYGGQAKEMRGEPNSVGLPTKRQPDMLEGAFFSDNDFNEVVTAVGPALTRLGAHLRKGGLVVWPTDGIGSGLAQLSERAPIIHRYYEQLLKNLRENCT